MKMYKKNRPALTYDEVVETMQDIAQDFLVKCGMRYGAKVRCAINNDVVGVNLDKSIRIANREINIRMKRDII